MQQPREEFLHIRYNAVLINEDAFDLFSKMEDARARDVTVVFKAAPYKRGARMRTGACAKPYDRAISALKQEKVYSFLLYIACLRRLYYIPDREGHPPSPSAVQQLRQDTRPRRRARRDQHPEPLLPGEGVRQGGATQDRDHRDP